MTSTDSPLESLTGALIEANDQLLALYELAKVSTSSLDVHASVGEILSRAKRLLDAESMLLFAEDGLILGEESDVASAGDRSIDDVRGGTTRTLTASTTASVQASNSSGLQATLIARRADRPFGTADHKLLSAVANMALGALHTSRLHQEAVDQAVVSRDHDTASELAVGALPKWRPDVPGFDLFARSDPARSAGGDLFTFAYVEEVLHFVVGDVSGKGLPAAMMMTNVISAAMAAFQTVGTSGPAAVVSAIDSWVYEYLSDAGLFVTLVGGSFDPASGVLRLANAGHSPVLFVRDGSADLVDASVPPIGVLPFEMLGEDALTESVYETTPGDRLIVSSDGFTEQENPSGEMLGDDEFARLICEDPGPTDDLGSRLFTMLERHADTAEQSDDRTLLILGVSATPKATDS